MNVRSVQGARMPVLASTLPLCSKVPASCHKPPSQVLRRGTGVVLPARSYMYTGRCRLSGFLRRPKTPHPIKTTTTATASDSVVGFTSSVEDAASQFTELMGELGVVGDDKVLALKEGRYGEPRRGCVCVYVDVRP